MNAADWEAENAEADEAENGSDGDVLIGKAKDWQPPKGAGPGRFTLEAHGGDIKCQVWPREYESNEESQTYKDAKHAAVENLEVSVEGRGEWQEFTAKKGPRAGKTMKSYQFTVWNVYFDAISGPTPEEWATTDAPKGEPVPVNDVATRAQQTIERILEEKKANTPKREKASSNGDNRLTKEEWAEKDRLKKASIDSWAAIKVAGNLCVAAGRSDLKDLEHAARGVLEIQARLNADLLSGSDGSETQAQQVPAN